MPFLDVVLPAGGSSRPDDPLYPLTRGGPKALLPLHGRPMAQWVLDALAGSPGVGRVIIIGLAPEHGLTCGDKSIDYLPSAGGLLDNVRAGLRRAQVLNPAARHVVLASADIPAVRSEHVDWLLAACAGSDRDFYYCVIERGLMERRYPESRRTYTHLKDRVVCGGDMNVVATRLAAGDNPLWEQIAVARKSVFRQAALIGYGTLLRLALRRIDLAAAERIVSVRLGLRGRALICPYPEMGMDVDKPFQHDILARDLAGRA
jgi:molybdopterin-guanine dinucleotide biosynthesis protein A